MPDSGQSSAVPLVSVITPTFGRPEMLERAYDIFAGQTYSNREWIVVDDSEEPCRRLLDLDDRRVRYIHRPNRESTGAKRNFAISRAKGSIIAQFDDDDFYHPKYLDFMVRAMAQRNADIVKLVAFFVYHQASSTLAYWDQMKRGSQHFDFGPAATRPKAMPHMPFNHSGNHLSYGFSFVFKRSVWEKTPFEDVSVSEDLKFMKAAIANKFKPLFVNDHDGLCLHMVHDRATSRSMPQYLLPAFLLKKLFPGAAGYFQKQQ